MQNKGDPLTQHGVLLTCLVPGLNQPTNCKQTPSRQSGRLECGPVGGEIKESLWTVLGVTQDMVVMFSEKSFSVRNAR